MKFKIRQTTLIFIASLIFVLFYNFSFINNTLNYYHLNESFFFITSLGFFLFLLTNIVLSLFCLRKATKPVLITIFILASLAAYAMDSYGIIIDDSMIVNLFRTNKSEAFDLFSFKLGYYFFLLGILPSFLVFKTDIEYGTLKNELWQKTKTILISFLFIFVILFSFGKNYATFFREHKPLRFYTNPVYFIFSTGKYIETTLTNSKKELIRIGLDAKSVSTHRKLIIFVVGETARGDRFSLNHYQKETNPYLSKEDVISFKKMTSCGTSTAISVPCIFSKMGRSQFDNKKASTTENLLDIFSHTKKINLLWRDNNSNSQGVADRVPYEDFKSEATNKICNPECRDVGMLLGLDDFVKKNENQKNDMFIVLHQMGNHGPQYSKRYPKEFEKFKPICETNELSKCTNEQINNSYDNAILYTDYFLSEVIKFLKKYSNEYDTAMIYVSDHGESLGENGVYLHGMPYFMAPYEQRHVASVFWFNDSWKKKMYFNKLKEKENGEYNHDNIFHTFLGLMDVKTSEYRMELDILNDLKK
jgi:lipid A ethanolaminephosphotransferase